ncbi:Cyclosome subunit 10 [Intoshia linei]|uniref:Anaphase-promoting complex subunit 10 n=1 Tax=Intoshia linei TaxID=1819745 RepID=A0A177B4K8_9BILA|nr:Cyclosome subunit 10 [Intoshia linei]
MGVPNLCINFKNNVNPETAYNEGYIDVCPQAVITLSSCKVDFYFNPKKRLIIRIGNDFSDLVDVSEVMIANPRGWIMIPLQYQKNLPVNVFLLQISIVQNYQNGRDSHVRGIKLMSKCYNSNTRMFKFSTPYMQQFSSLR